MDTVLPAVDAALGSARRTGRLLEVGIATTIRAQAHYRLGRLREAEEDARLADRLAEGYDSRHRRHTQAWLLHCLVERGVLVEAEGELASSAVPVTVAPLLAVRARLRLAQDRPAEALADLDECGRRLARREVLHPNFAPWQAWSAVALLRLGREEEGRTRAADALRVAREFGSARAEGVALWASGLVERSADVLADAVAVLHGVPAPVERARALVDLGAALRRANRRSDARRRLEEGLQLAHECGADVLVATARAELACAGVHLRRRAVSGPDALTPTERRIAERAAGGASNRNIAQALFVTPKPWRTTSATPTTSSEWPAGRSFPLPSPRRPDLTALHLQCDTGRWWARWAGLAPSFPMSTPGAPVRTPRRRAPEVTTARLRGGVVDWCSDVAHPRVVADR